MLQVRTGCRLHFGLMELARGEELQYAGLGLTLNQPELILEFTPAERGFAGATLPDAQPHLTAQPPEKAFSEVDRRIADVCQLRESLHLRSVDCEVRPIAALPMHHGLGSGTQLAAAAAVGLELCDQLSHWDQSKSGAVPGATKWQPLTTTAPQINPQWLLKQSGRGLRSAVGLHGFLYGGLVLDHGYREEANLGSERSLETRCQTLPREWRVVLIIPPCDHAISGSQEAELLEAVGRRANPHRVRMFELATELLLINQGQSPNFELFVNLLDEYMELAARIFIGPQGGPYNGPVVTQAVAVARQAGLRAVGQSSWGPTVFGFASDPDQAQTLCDRLQQQCAGWSIRVVTPAWHGAQWRCL